MRGFAEHLIASFHNEDRLCRAFFFCKEFDKCNMFTEADPGFLERGVICKKVWEFALLILSHFLKYPMKMKYFGLTATTLFHFHRI